MPKVRSLTEVKNESDLYALFCNKARFTGNGYTVPGYGLFAKDTEVLFEKLKNLWERQARN